MNANDKIYFEGIVLNEGAYFYSYYNNIDETAKKKNIKDCFKSIKEKTDDFVKIGLSRYFPWQATALTT